VGDPPRASRSALFNGLWLVFIGWFLLSAARGSAIHVLMERALGGVSLAAAMEPTQPLVDAQSSVDEALQTVVLGQGSRYFFVQDAGQVIGLVTLHQVRTVAPGERSKTPVRAIMLDREALVTVPLHASLWDAFLRMGEEGIAQVPVEHEGRLVGVLTRARLQAIMQNRHDLAGA